MRIEIQAEGSEPQIYPLNKTEIILGSGAGSDIIVISYGVSRRHAKITQENGIFLVTDFGSTNGTFINEERIIPGKAVEFTTFFPLRLGAYVLVSLLSDVDGQTVKDLQSRQKISNTSSDKSGATRVIGLNDLKKAKTQDLIKKKIAQAKLPSAKKTEASSTMKGPILLGILILLAAGYIQYSMTDQIETVIEKKVVSKSTTPVKKIVPVVPVKLLLTQEELLSKDRITSIFSDLKCTNPIEASFCKMAGFTGQDRDGVTQVGSNFIFFINQGPWLDLAFKAMPEHSVMPASLAKPIGEGEVVSMDTLRNEVPENLKKVIPEDELYRIAFLMFLGQRMGNLSNQDLNERSFYFVFHRSDVTKVMALTPEGFQSLMMSMSSDTMNILKVSGYKTFERFKAFYRYF